MKRRPPGLLCITCARRVLRSSSDEDIHVFQLKLADWLKVERVETRPCLSVCPEAGVTVERRGKSMVLDQSAIEQVHAQFDPTRQLSFF
ncbi:MAG: hypothetical protein RBT63_10760 [Bdellovibrionales bacterium]|nr:hypothetical protein [Bdellovibrionales bacterium]